MTSTGQIQLTYNVAEVAIPIGDKSRNSTRHTHRPLLSTFSSSSQRPGRAQPNFLSSTLDHRITHQHQDSYCTDQFLAHATNNPLRRQSAASASVVMTTSAGRRSVDSSSSCSTGGHNSDMGIRRGTVMEKVANVFCGGNNTQQISASTGGSATMKSFSSSKTTSSSSSLPSSSSSSQEIGRTEPIAVSPAMVRRDVNARAVLKKEKPPVPPRDRSTICRSRQSDSTTIAGSNVFANSYTVPSSSSSCSAHYDYNYSTPGGQDQLISHTSKSCLSAIDNSSNATGSHQQMSSANSSSNPSLPSEMFNQVALGTKTSSNNQQHLSQPPPPPQRSKPIPPDKPSRFSFQKMFASQQALVAGAARGVYGGVISTGARSPRVWRKQTSSSSLHSSVSTTSGASSVSVSNRSRFHPPPYISWQELWQEEKFLDKFFRYALPSVLRTPYYGDSWKMNVDPFAGDSIHDNRMDEDSVFAVCRLSSVCRKWRDILYRRPHYWYHLRLCLDCHQMRADVNDMDVQPTRQRLFGILQLRLCDSVSLVNAQDDDLQQLPLYFPASTRCLRNLRLSMGRFSDRGLEQLLTQLAAVTSLQLAGCNEITDAALWSSLQPRICQLSVADCINISDEAVAAVAQLLPALEELSLQAYHVTDTALTYFAHKASSNCTTLRLHSCWELTNHAALNIANSLPNLRVLSLAGCSKITDEGIEIIAENVKGLRSLNVSWCMRVTDTALEVIACDLGQLQELILDRCIHVSDVGIGYLSTLSSLRTLSVRWCTHVHDAGLQHVCSMRQLNVLRLSGCTHISAEALSNLTQLRHLVELELTNCPGATQELHSYLSERLPHCTVYN